MTLWIRPPGVLALNAQRARPPQRPSPFVFVQSQVQEVAYFSLPAILRSAF
jgi:hypothetical protein